MKKLFGTDGIRAVAGEYPLDPASVYELGRSLVGLLKDEGLALEVLIGRDTRESGPWIEAAFARGVADEGGTAHFAGVIPTSGVAFLTKTSAFSAGAVISASHNPYRDNGIKIFCAQGFKIPDAWEKRLEAPLLRAERRNPPAGDGSSPAETRLIDRYINFLVGRLDGLRRAKPYKVVLDCAHGAASQIAPEVFQAVGCGIVCIHNHPDGKNINVACGSLHPEGMAAAVVREGADFGIAYDGDADRALWADGQGRLLNGDHTLYILAKYMSAHGSLKAGAVVATTMSNLGLEKALRRSGLRLDRAQVGDKYVLEKMIELGANLGGERSGHTILLDDCPTGDGILTSLKMLEAMAVTGGTLAELAEGFVEYPQVLLNVQVTSKPRWAGIPAIAEAIEAVRTEMAGRGRLDVRYSGTEPLARIMIEGEDQGEIEALARRIASAFEKHIGA